MIITELFAFIIEETPGSEGVPAFTAPSGIMFPLMGADWTRVESLRPIAKQMAKLHGKPVTLCKFSIREEVEVIDP